MADRGAFVNRWARRGRFLERFGARPALRIMPDRYPHLRQVEIANPCPLRWEDLEGGEAVRHCAQCRHRVYNLAEMSAREAEDLLSHDSVRVCVLLTRRTDGSVVTRDEAVAPSKGRFPIFRPLLALAGVLATLMGAGCDSAKPEAGGIPLIRSTKKAATPNGQPPKASQGDGTAVTVGKIQKVGTPVPSSEPSPIPIVGMVTRPPDKGSR